MKTVLRLIVSSLVILIAGLPTFAQVTTATIVGTVTTDNAGLPGATVTISSPSLQGTRTTVTGDGGASSGAAVVQAATVR